MRPSELADLQSWMLELVTAPGGARSLGERAERVVGARVCGDERASALDRLDIYANAYFARIHRVLERDFPALVALLGEAAFHDLARLYLVVNPSNHFSLREVGAGLPGFLASEAGRYFHERWPCAADLARLERALVEVFDARDAVALAREELVALPPEEWGALRLARIPASVLVEIAWPVHELRSAVDGGRPVVAPVHASPGRLLVWRQRERVYHRALSAREAHLLSRLGTRVRFEDLCELLELDADEPTDPVAELVAFLGRWVADGLLASADDVGSPVGSG